MDALPAFDVPYPSRTTVGAGAAELAAEELARLGISRAGIVASRSVAASEAFARWRAGLGGDHLLFTDVRAHTPRESVVDAGRTFADGGCDGVVSFGGGSAIDTAKGAALVLSTGIEEASQLDRFVGGRAADGSPLPFALDAAPPPHVAIPTTLSGAAHTHSAGVTDEARGEKFLHINPALGPRSVLLDPLVTRETPTSLWTSTGVKALEHAVESLYSNALPALLQPLRMRAFTILSADLVPSVSGGASPDELAACRARVLAAAGMSVFAWPSGPLGVSHALGHQAGATWHIRHGDSAAIFLPRALEFNAPAADGPLREMAYALGLSTEPALPAILSRLDEVFSSLELPRRLSQIGVGSTESFDHLAEAALRDPIMAGNPRPARKTDLVEILHSAL